MLADDRVAAAVAASREATASEACRKSEAMPVYRLKCTPENWSGWIAFSMVTGIPTTAPCVHAGATAG